MTTQLNTKAAKPAEPDCKQELEFDETDFVETENFNDEPVPYTSNKEA